MADLDVERYKKSITNAMGNWSKKLDAVDKDLDPTWKELDQLDKLSRADLPPVIADAVKKRQAELRKKADDLQKKLDTANLELRADLMLIDPPKNADPAEVKKLPAWLQGIISKGGLPLGKNVAINKPDVDFDLKTGQLKKLVVKFSIDWP